MDAFIANLSSHLAISLFLIIGLGLAIGNVKFAGLSLGASAILLVGMLFGHFGVRLPKEISDLGVVLFVYSVGLQVGPRFFRAVISKGFAIVLIVFFSTVSVIAILLVCVKLLGIPSSLGIGMLFGALTSTPALAAALDIRPDPAISVGYGIAYPFGLIGIVVFVQILTKLKSTKEEIKNEGQDPKTLENKVQVKQYLVTNPNCTDKTLVEIDIHGMTQANITRIKRNDQIFMAHDDLVLELNDIVMAVGTLKELKKLEHLLGKETQTDMDYSKNISARDVFVSSPKVVGKSLKELEIKELFGVVITRLRRDAFEIVPTGKTVMEIGDMIHVVGDKEDCERFVKIIGQQERKLHETNLLPMIAGMIIGAILGLYPIQLAGGIKFQLGLAGGPLIIALLAGHFGRLGKTSTRVPYAAKYITREIGLVLFLAVAGTNAGSSFYSVFRETGFVLVIYGEIITLTAMGSVYIMAYYIFKMGNLSSIGLICGAMTCTPALGLVNNKIDSDTPTLAYASIYAISLVSRIVVAQLTAMGLV